MPLVRGIRRFVDIPSTWEGWVMRVMTIGVVLVLAVQGVLGAQQAKLIQLTEQQNTFMQDSRDQRTAFQREETQRQCLGLLLQGATQTQLEGVKC